MLSSGQTFLDCRRLPRFHSFRARHVGRCSATGTPSPTIGAVTRVKQFALSVRKCSVESILWSTTCPQYTNWINYVQCNVMSTSKANELILVQVLYVVFLICDLDKFCVLSKMVVKCLVLIRKISLDIPECRLNILLNAVKVVMLKW